MDGVVFRCNSDVVQSMTLRAGTATDTVRGVLDTAVRQSRRRWQFQGVRHMFSDDALGEKHRLLSVEPALTKSHLPKVTVELCCAAVFVCSVFGIIWALLSFDR
jgi:hypothetical protein